MNTSGHSTSKRQNSPAEDGKFELLLFRLGEPSESKRSELFGINVFKVREIVVAPKITTIANAPPFAVGLADVRGQMIPVIDLPALTGCTPQTNTGIVLVTEFARTTQAFIVDEVVEIIQLEWKHLLAAEGTHAGLLSGIARIDGDAPSSRLAQILDVEQILRDVFPGAHGVEEDVADVSAIQMPQGTVILFADDSHVARLLIEKSLSAMNVNFISVKNGKEAWERLGGIHMEAVGHGKKASDTVAIVLTDLEMPEMDGFTLTRNIKQDARFAGIPVIVYSSLTGSASEGHADAVGADAYVAKFEPKELAQTIRTTLINRGWQP
ncbi:MAG: chemotaxis protein CheV [Betaproteobacteria bacterium]|jgi:two-component system chemotaxis response regulator CheV|nr:chemotaxis protein CheV [Betaproteobacteria bacterium]MBK7654308.1 chemotaxis protein CheV [Betaproteobacteria bacterium]MBP6644443.1 chemotaxis protein CheV [Burkholderiaceae bacterium]